MLSQLRPWKAGPASHWMLKQENWPLHSGEAAPPLTSGEGEPTALMGELALFSRLRCTGVKRKRNAQQEGHTQALGCGFLEGEPIDCLSIIQSNSE